MGCRHASKTRYSIKPAFSNSLEMSFVKLPPGAFIMGKEGTPLSSPTHKVKLSGFFMMTTEVTNKQFESFMKIKRPKYSELDNMPVMNVSRSEIDQFITWLSKRDNRRYSLPTEAQWEYAARSGLKDSDYPWGNKYENGRANIGGSLSLETAKAVSVGQFEPNTYGLFDMCGNAGEIVMDSYYDYSKNSLVDPRAKPPIGDEDGIVRGLGINDYFPQVWFRSPMDPASREYPYGFRLVVNE